MGEMSVSSNHGLDMGIQVVKASTGKIEGHVAEADLEPFGWGLDPLGSIERYKAHMEELRLQAVTKGEPDQGSWLNTEIIVHPDEEFGYPSERYYLKLDAVLLTTRKESLLRQTAQYLLDLANGIDSQVPFVGGRGIEFGKES